MWQLCALWSCSVTKSCPTLCSPMNCSMPGCPFTFCQSLLKFTSTEMVMLSNHLILYVLCPETEPRGQASMKGLCHLLSVLSGKVHVTMASIRNCLPWGQYLPSDKWEELMLSVFWGRQRNRLLSQKFYLMIWNFEKSFSLISEVSSLVLPSHE